MTGITRMKEAPTYIQVNWGVAQMRSDRLWALPGRHNELVSQKHLRRARLAQLFFDFAPFRVVSSNIPAQLALFYLIYEVKM